MDKVRVYWHEQTTTITERSLYSARIEGSTDGRATSDMILFTSWDRDEFFRRYNAITLEKAPPEEADHGEKVSPSLG